MLWGGGRYTPVDNINLHNLLDEYNKHPEIKLRHVFTNCLLNQTTINDYKCNKFVCDFIRLQDEVIVNHPLLIEHFQTYYPRIPIIYSTTLDIKNIDKVNEITKTNIYVLNYNYNNDNSYLEQLEHKENVEIICAEPCEPNCPYRMEHYKTISQRYLSVVASEESVYICPFGSEGKLFFDVMKSPLAITNGRLKELEAQGFQYFKISGRTTLPPQWLETVLYYLAKPEYINEIRETLLNTWW